MTKCTYISENAYYLQPAAFLLEQNYPNPFNPATVIRFAMPQPGPVRLQVFDVLGRLVETLVDEARSTGRYTVTWEPKRRFFYRLQTGRHEEIKRMILLR